MKKSIQKEYLRGEKNPDSKKIAIIKYLIRSSIIWIGEIFGLMLMSYMSIGLSIDNWVTAAIVIIILEIINAIFWPILAKIFLPILVYTVGIGSILLNASILWIVSIFITGLNIEGIGFFIVPLGIAMMNTILASILTLPSIDEDSYYDFIIRRRRIIKKHDSSHPNGIIILEIDGLAHDILKEAIEKGYMPTLAKWIKDKKYEIKKWETDLSSQTSASQAGILHGNNEGIVAFRWVEKENNNKIRVSSGFLDAPILEKRISNGKGLLCKNGASRSNLFSGDTNNVIFTYSALSNIKKLYNSAWYYIYSNPSNFGRILLLCGYDILKESISQIKYTIKNIQPRIRRGFQYLFIRAVANVLIREINTQTIIGDMIKGNVDIIYSTYLGYDEIAHHSGIRSDDSFYSLKGLDRQIKRIAGANKHSEKYYDVVIQSDHGQSNGATFKQRYGINLRDFVYNLLPENMKLYSELYSNEDHFSQVITFPIQNLKGNMKNKSLKAKKAYKNLYGKINLKKENILDYTKKYKLKNKIKSEKNNKLGKNEAIVLASGNMGLIYITKWKKRLTYEKIKVLFPNLIPGLVNHDGIGFILIDSEDFGGIAIGKKGVYYLNENRFEGENPLLDFGENAKDHLLKTNSFKHCPDILVNSLYDEENDEVAAFEELIGSHGGLGGTQSKPFIMHPSNWEIADDIVGSEEIHKVLKKQFQKLNNNN